MKPTCVWWDVHHASMRSSAACSWRITYSTPPWGSERRRPAYVERGEMIVRDNARQLKNRVCVWLQARHLAVHPYQHRRVAPVVLCALLLYVVYATLLTPSGWGRWGIPRCRLTHCLGVSCVSSPSSPLLSLNSLARPPTTPIQPHPYNHAHTHSQPHPNPPTHTNPPTRVSPPTPHTTPNSQFPRCLKQMLEDARERPSEPRKVILHPSLPLLTTQTPTPPSAACQHTCSSPTTSARRCATRTLALPLVCARGMDAMG